jgi:DNA invertase Pin-like site-specific DNA recombinase
VANPLAGRVQHRQQCGSTGVKARRERTQAGLAAARRAGRTGGRPPKLTDEDIEAAKAMLANPDIGVTQIAHRLGVSPATL